MLQEIEEKGGEFEDEDRSQIKTQEEPEAEYVN